MPPLQIVSTAAFGIAGQLGNNAQGLTLRTLAHKAYAEGRSRAIAAREYMIKLRGENDQIDNESVATLRDGGAKELQKSA